MKAVPGTEGRGRRSAGALVAALLLAATASTGAAPASAESAQTADRGRGVVEESTRAQSGFGWGIELRRTGIGPCRPSTPAPCSGHVYTTSCPAPGQARLTRVRTYMWAYGTAFVGLQLRAKLIERGQPAHTVPWSTPDVEHFTGRTTVTERLMDTRNISGLVDTATQWDLQVEYRFDRSGGRTDVVRVQRWGPVDLTC
jgi:hypothetical protein